MTKLGWLHLSDIHMQTHDEFDRDVVVESLITDIRNRCKEGLQPEFIVFSGDVAYHGRDDEYQFAVEHFFEPLLKATNLSQQDLFLVPGNHDVDWEIIELLSPELAKYLDNREKVNNLLGSEKRREIIFQSMANYRKFIYDFFGQSWNPQDDPLYACSRTFIQKGSNRRVAILGINSAWSSGFFKGVLGEYGQLLVGERQVADAIAKSSDTDFSIAVIHHPFGWLKEFDRIAVESRLREKCEFILHGHLHSSGFVSEFTLEGGTVTIPCGAAYYRRDYPDGYNFVQLDIEKKSGVIWLWRYADRHRKWIKDIETTGEERDGKVEFSWGKELSSKVGVVNRQPDKSVEAALSVSEILAIAPIRERLRWRLEILYERFRPCYETCTLALIEGKALSDNDFQRFVQAWENCKGDAYYDAISYAETLESLMAPESPYFERLQSSKNRIDNEIKKHARHDIIEAGLQFNEALMNFLAFARNSGQR